MFSCSTLTAQMIENAHKVSTDIVLDVHNDAQLIRRALKTGTLLRHTPTANLHRPSHTSRTRGIFCAVIAC